MRRKPVPPAPADRDGLRAVRRALPRAPRPEGDCCRRLVSRAGVSDRATAREWLPFLAALGLARETADGSYVRTDAPLDPDAVAAAFRENVYAAAEVLAALDDADGPIDADEAFARVEDVVPRWERERGSDWPETWRERVARLLAWAVLLGLAERANGGYRRA